MTEQWVVSVNGTFYGPTDDEDLAREFAEFLTAEVDPAVVHRLHSLTRELLAHYNAFIKTIKIRVEFPVEWPPHPGDIWQDRNGDRWACSNVGAARHSYLFCLAHPGDDPAEDIWKEYGPMRRVMFVPVNEEEPPF